MGVDTIVDWLRRISEPFDIVYVSGDTDSFAPPRTAQGLDLLEGIAALEKDILFTTRAVFNDTQLDRLRRLNSTLQHAGRLLIGCVSVAQLTHPHLEPHPIPPPAQRLLQLHRFHEAGLAAILAMRPFLPVVAVEEYLELIDKAGRGVDAVLGEVWYADQSGVLEAGVFRGPTPSNVEFGVHTMDFDANDALWKVYEPKDVIARVAAHCANRALPFFMRSKPAIDLLRSRSAPKSPGKPSDPE